MLVLTFQEGEILKVGLKNVIVKNLTVKHEQAGVFGGWALGQMLVMTLDRVKRADGG